MILDPTTDPESTALVEQADAIRPNAIAAIESPEDYELYATRIRDVRALERRLEERRKALTSPLDSAKRVLMDWFRAPAERLAATRAEYEAAMHAWDIEQGRLRREAEARAREAAAKERERIEREAAAARAKAEAAAAKARAREEAKAAAAAAAGRAEEAERRRAAAEEAEAQRRIEAERIEAERRAIADAIPAEPVIEMSAPKVAGVHTRKSWRYRIANPALVPREYLMVDEVKVGKVVRALGPDTSIAGIEVYEESSYVTRSRA